MDVNVLLTHCYIEAKRNVTLMYNITSNKLSRKTQKTTNMVSKPRKDLAVKILKERIAFQVQMQRKLMNCKTGTKSLASPVYPSLTNETFQAVTPHSNHELLDQSTETQRNLPVTSTGSPVKTKIETSSRNAKNRKRSLNLLRICQLQNTKRYLESMAFALENEWINFCQRTWCQTIYRISDNLEIDRSDLLRICLDKEAEKCPQEILTICRMMRRLSLDD